MWKVYDNDAADDDDDGQRTNCDQKSLLEPSAQVSYKHPPPQIEPKKRTCKVNYKAVLSSKQPSASYHYIALRVRQNYLESNL